MWLILYLIYMVNIYFCLTLTSNLLFLKSEQKKEVTVFLNESISIVPVC